LIWFGYGLLPKVIVVALICFFPIVVNTVDGLRSVDPDLVNLMRSMGASRRQLFTKAQLPSALPYLFSGTKVGIAVSVIGAVIGEWVGASAGLGYFMVRSASQFQTSRVFAAVVVLSIMGVALFALAAYAERRLLPWHHEKRRGGVGGRWEEGRGSVL
jgi:ABC-type nitrate/sulfonate/bicarbonate transport system permease component